MATSENIETIASSTGPNLSIFSLVSSTDLTGKLVIVFLIVASVWSWAIIINKILSYCRIKQKLKLFEQVFWSGQVLEDFFEKIKHNIDNPMAAIFVSAMNECKKSKSISTNNPSSNIQLLKTGFKDRIMQAMYLARNRETAALEQKLNFLASVGSYSPFVGLFGTVWGIMHSFQSIAATKNTSIAVVAPGIAEALFVTAMGLLVAIPAVIFYNYLTSAVEDITNRMEYFISELNILLSRAIDEDKM